MNTNHLGLAAKYLQAKINQAQQLGFSGAVPEWTDDAEQNEILAQQYDGTELLNFLNTAGIQSNGAVSDDMAKIYQEIQQYKDDPYIYKQLMNMYNSYLSQQFNPNLAQQIAEGLGDNSSRTNFENQRIAGLRSEIQKITESQHTEDVTDPINQAQKQREAGLNPDLMGGISAQQAGSIDQAEQAPALVNDGQQSFSTVVNEVMSVVQSGFAFAQHIQGLEANDISLGIQQMDFFNKSNDFLFNVVANALTEDEIKILLDPYGLDKDGKRLYDDEQISNAGLRFSSAITDVIQQDSRFSPALKRKFRRSFRISSRSPLVHNNIYKMFSDMYNNKKSAVEAGGDPRFSKSFETCLTIFGERMQRCYLDIEDLESKYKHDKLSARSEDGKSIGTLAGEAEIATSESEKYQRDYEKIINKMWDDIMIDLEKNDDFLSTFFRFLVPIIRTNFSNFRMK